MEEKNIHLSGLPQDHGFKTPERYFEQLPTRIMQRTAAASARGGGAVSVSSWFWQLKTGLAGAAMAAVFVVSFLATQTWDLAGKSSDASLAQVSNLDIQQYLLTHAELEATDVADLASVKAPQALEFLEVRHEDVNVDAAMELLEDNAESQSLYFNE